MRHLKRYFLLLLAVTFILSASFASPAFAVDMSPNVHPIWANATPTCAFYNTYASSGGQWINNSFSNNSTTQDVTYSIGKINCDYPAQLSTKNTYAVYSFRIDNFNYNDSADSGLLGVKADTSLDSAKFGVIGVNLSAMGSTGYQFDVYLYGQVANLNGGTIHLYNPLNADEIFYLKPRERVTFVGASYWQVTTDADFEYDYRDVLSAISTKINNIDSNVSNIRTGIWNVRDAINETNSKLDDLIDAQEQANDDANDRYQDEKDTIDNNASDAQDTANNADFSFTVGNPLTTWLGLFTGSNCVSIPTIASWIHSNETSVCSPWSSSVRDVTTPIISVLSGTILFGFIVRWLNGSSFNESIEVG